MNEWTPYLMEAPPTNALVRFWHEYTGEKWTGSGSELRLDQGVGCLWWKLTGIERFKGEAWL